MNSSTFFRSICIVILGVSLSGSAFARELHEVMHEMGDTAKTISKQIGNREKNTDSASKTEVLRALVLEALAIEPEKVARMPEPTPRKVEFLEYQKMMSGLYSFTSELQQNFLRDENDLATQTFTKIRDIQKQGHERFRIPER